MYVVSKEQFSKGIVKYLVAKKAKRVKELDRMFDSRQYDACTKSLAKNNN